MSVRLTSRKSSIKNDPHQPIRSPGQPSWDLCRRSLGLLAPCFPSKEIEQQKQTVKQSDPARRRLGCMPATAGTPNRGRRGTLFWEITALIKIPVPKQLQFKAQRVCIFYVKTKKFVSFLNLVNLTTYLGFEAPRASLRQKPMFGLHSIPILLLFLLLILLLFLYCLLTDSLIQLFLIIAFLIEPLDTLTRVWHKEYCF